MAEALSFAPWPYGRQARTSVAGGGRRGRESPRRQEERGAAEALSFAPRPTGRGTVEALSFALWPSASLASSETAQLQFLLEFGLVQARFIEELLFLCCVYEPHCVHKKVKTYVEVLKSNSRIGKDRQNSNNTRQSNEIVMLSSSIWATDYL